MQHSQGLVTGPPRLPFIYEISRRESTYGLLIVRKAPRREMDSDGVTLRELEGIQSSPFVAKQAQYRSTGRQANAAVISEAPLLQASFKGTNSDSLDGAVRTGSDKMGTGRKTGGRASSMGSRALTAKRHDDSYTAVAVPRGYADIVP